ncbi:uncharacterized protein LOC101896411 [Musca domestica]|uniref:Uncharacterized protein LOC101896411 n=1 Tax=Musca domestica TaxID=7370 RepID=A0A1I8MI09_MUSDO|nr:uncharacterized protein LOC101896411 [Musca domestica]
MPSKRMCCIPNCENGQKFHYSTTSLHILKDAWKTRLRNKYSLPDQKRMFICGNHFAPHMFIKGGRKLREHAYPTLLMPEETNKNMEFLEEVVILADDIDMEDAIEEVDFIDEESQDTSTSGIDVQVEKDDDTRNEEDREETSGKEVSAEGSDKSFEMENVMVFSGNELEMEHTIIMVESIDQDSDSDANTSCGTLENKIPPKKFKKNTSNGNVVLTFSQNAEEEVSPNDKGDSKDVSKHNISSSNNFHIKNKDKYSTNNKIVGVRPKSPPPDCEKIDSQEVFIYPDPIVVEDAIAEVDNVEEHNAPCPKDEIVANIKPSLNKNHTFELKFKRLENKTPAKKFKKNTSNGNVVVFPKNGDEEAVIETENSIKVSKETLGSSNNLNDKCNNNPTPKNPIVQQKSPTSNCGKIENHEVVLYEDDIEDALAKMDAMEESKSPVPQEETVANAKPQLNNNSIFALKFKRLEEENRDMRKIILQLETKVKSLEAKMNLLEKKGTTCPRECGKCGASTLQKGSPKHKEKS